MKTLSSYMKGRSTIRTCIFFLRFIKLMEPLSILTSESGIIFIARQVVTFFTRHLSKSETVFRDEIFTAFHTYMLTLTPTKGH